MTRILGIDPGYGRIGWGIIEGERNTWRHVAHGCIETSPKETLSERLFALSGALQQIISEYHPTRAGVEQLFFKKNVTTGLSVAHARGVMLLVLHNNHIPIVEVAPVQVKQSVSGYGNAQKGQVQVMVALLLGMKEKKIQDDAADALAVAFATTHNTRLIAG